MMRWLEILSSATTLCSLAGGVIFALAFWKLNLLASTPVIRTGFIAALVDLAIWLIYGMLSVLTMLPNGISGFVIEIYQIPFLWQILWGTVTVSFGISLVCLAWTLHRGIHPTQPVP